VFIWTNYVTDNGDALQAAEKSICANIISRWAVHSVSRDFTAPDGTKWTANQMFTFVLDKATQPQALQCLSKGIIKAGGPSGTPDCTFGPLIYPRKREVDGREE